MKNNIVNSVLKVVGCENILYKDELNYPVGLSVGELLDEKEKADKNKTEESTSIEEKKDIS